MAYVINVESIYNELNEMLRDKWGYIMGKCGQIWTRNDQVATQDANAKKYGEQWIGHRVTDCSGVMVYIWKKFGLKMEHSSNAIARRYVGEMTKLPRPGYAAFKWRQDGAPARWLDGKGDYYHIGIVGEDGATVYEAQGTRVGFTTSHVKKWTYFAPFKDVEYAKKKEDKKEEISLNRVAITTDKVNVRKQPNKSAARVDYANAGDIADVLSEKNGWYELQFVDRKLKGWVYGSFVIPVDAGEVAQPNDASAGDVFFSMETESTIEFTREEAEELYDELKKLLGR